MQKTFILYFIHATKYMIHVKSLSKRLKLAKIRVEVKATLAQLVERRTRNAQAIGSIPVGGSI